MKKKIIGLLAALIIIIGLSSPVALAVDPYNGLCTKAPDSSACINRNTNPLSGSDSLFMKITNILLIAAGITAVVMVMYGGLQMIMATGESEKFASGRKTLLYAAAGLLVVLLSKVIIGFIIGLL